MVRRRDIWLWVALAALLAGSCAKTQGPEEGSDEWTQLTGSHPIAFGSSLADVATKGPLPNNSSFGVFAFYQPEDENGAPGTWGDGWAWTPNFMYNQEVHFDGSTYTYTPIKYWPNNEEDTITFWAYYPYNDTNIDRFRVVNSETTYSNLANNLPNIEYTTDGHTDFLVSDLKEDQHYHGENPPNPDAIVPFIFSHAMCWVDFVVRKVDPDNLFDIELSQLRIENIYFSGVYNQELGWVDFLGERGNISVFDDEENPANRVDLNDPNADPPAEPLSLPADGDPLIMPLPQNLIRGKKASLHVEYTIDSTSYSYDVLIGNILNKWEQNKHYTFRVNINPGNPILFTATVQPWDAVQEVYYTFGDE